MGVVFLRFCFLSGLWPMRPKVLVTSKSSGTVGCLCCFFFFQPARPLSFWMLTWPLWLQVPVCPWFWVPAWSSGFLVWCGLQQNRVFFRCCGLGYRAQGRGAVRPAFESLSWLLVVSYLGSLEPAWPWVKWVKQKYSAEVMDQKYGAQGRECSLGLLSGFKEC